MRSIKGLSDKDKNLFEGTHLCFTQFKEAYHFSLQRVISTLFWDALSHELLIVIISIDKVPIAGLMPYADIVCLETCLGKHIAQMVRVSC